MRNHGTSAFAGALLLATIGCGGGGEAGLRNGYVRLELQHDVVKPQVDASATMTVFATLHYDECLADFYASDPSMRQDGTIGIGDFGDADGPGEGWMDRLCDGSIDGTIDCEVEAIDQVLDNVQQLTVTYTVEGILDNAVLAFGPLPTAHTAHCAAGSLPTVHVSSNDAIRGEDATGTTIWQAATFDPTKVATGPSSIIHIQRGPAD